MKNQQSSFYKGSLTAIIMKLLQDNGRMYGYEITQKVKQLSDNNFKITEGALYPALHKLETKGLVISQTEQVDNRIRKYYKITEKGIEETNTKIAEIEQVITILQQILLPKKLIQI